MHLTADQRESLEKGEPVRAHEGGLEYVILRVDVFEQIKTLISHEDDWTPDELRALAARAVEDADTAGPIP